VIVKEEEEEDGEKRAIAQTGKVKA